MAPGKTTQAGVQRAAILSPPADSVKPWRWRSGFLQRCVGESQYDHRTPPGSEGFGACPDGRTRCYHIVDEPCDHPRRQGRSGECGAEVGRPLRGRQHRLLTGCLYPPDPVGCDRLPAGRSDPPRNQQALVEPPLPLPGRVQRHRDQQVDTVESRELGHGGQASPQLHRQPAMAGELDRVDSLPQDACERPQNQGALDRRRPVPALGTVVRAGATVSRRRVVPRATAAWTAVRGRADDLVAAGGAQGPVHRIDGSPADRAMGRVDEIEKTPGAGAKSVCDPRRRCFRCTAILGLGCVAGH